MRKDKRKKLSGSGLSTQPALELRQSFIDRVGGWAFVLCVLGVLTLSFGLNTAALDWGQCGYISWQPDSIEGYQTLCHMPRLFKTWTHKYPRGQYLINAAFYQPLLSHWTKHPVEGRDSQGRLVSSVLDAGRLYKLAGIARWISAIMSVLIVWAVILISLSLFKDKLAACLAGLTLSTSVIYIFYSCSGCVDIPAMFWFTWACFGVVKAVETNKWRYYLLLGFCCAYSVCTKEGVGTFIVGLGLAMWALMIEKSRRDGLSWQKSVGSIFTLRILVTIAVIFTVFLTLEGFWNGSAEFTARITHWGQVVKDEFLPRFHGHLPILWQSCTQLYLGLGWPYMAALVVALVYWGWRFRWKLVFALGPLVTFYLLTVLNIVFNAPRFMLCGYVGIAVMIGKTLADFLRYKRVPVWLRYPPVVFLFVVSLVGSVGLDLEMRNDTRVRAERWVNEHIDKGELVAVSMKKIYAPRLIYNGYKAINDWSSRGVRTQSGLQKVYPKYLVASPDWPCIPNNSDPEFRKKLFADETGYVKVAEFGPLYFANRQSLWGINIRPQERIGRLSPRMWIYEKRSDDIMGTDK